MFKAKFQNPENSRDVEIIYFKTAAEAVSHEIAGKSIVSVVKVDNVPDCAYEYESARECL